MGDEQYPKEALGKVATLIMGQSPPGSTYNDIGEGVPFFQGVRDFGDRHPSRRVYCTAPTRFAEPEDILFSVRAPIGEVNRAIEHCSIGRGLAVIRGERVLDTTFLEYVLRNIKREWNILEGQGAVFGNAKKSDLENLMVPWPRECERHAIAHILGTLDDKIELNKRMNETLEAMARAIFKSWFIDFDPVRAKAEGRDPGLPKEITDLFPDSFEDSELGKIPKGWRATTLKNVVLIHDSKRIPLNSRQRAKRVGSYPYYGASGVIDYVDDYLFEGIYVLVGEDGSVIDEKNHPITQYVWGRFWVNNHAHVLTGKNGISNEHLYLALRNTNIRAFVTGAVQPKLNQRNLMAIPFVLPPEQISNLFTLLIRPLFGRLRTNSDESRTLAAIRDTLLPKLISGEIRVNDADKFVENTI